MDDRTRLELDPIALGRERVAQLRTNGGRAVGRQASVDERPCEAVETSTPVEQMPAEDGGRR